MELETAKTTTNFVKAPKIRKGYYPGMLVQVKERKDREGNYVEGKFGRQIIMSFAIYEPTNNNTTPTKQIMIEKEGEKIPLEIAKFVYHQYKNDDGTFRTAVSEKSNITKIFEALGWEYKAKTKINTDDFIGRWAELNVDDYTKKGIDGEDIIASTIKDVSKLSIERKEGATAPSTSNNDFSEEEKELQQLVEQGVMTQSQKDEAMRELKKTRQ